MLIIVQNLPVPLDRRVWLECRALTRAGYRVMVVCPKHPGDPGHEVREGIDLYKYRPYPPVRNRAGFVAEYCYSFAATAWLAARIWRRHGFDAIQACNPPDIFWPIARWFRLRRGTRFVFDQHDLCPELYDSRFPGGPRLPYRGLLFLERCTYRAADAVIATNGSYRKTAIVRGGKRPEEVTVVRTGPDQHRLRRQVPDPALRRGRRYLVCYLGVMGPQDGVDIAMRAADAIVHRLGRTDVTFIFMGSGDCLPELIALRDRLGLGGYVELPGRVPDETVFRVFSTADVGLSPDPMNPLNDVSTMNKTMEYMAFGLPVVAFDLLETRVSAEDAAVYVPQNDVMLYARAIVSLLEDEHGRARMGAIGRARVEHVLAWEHQKEGYVGTYDRLLSRRPERSPRARPSSRTQTA